MSSNSPSRNAGRNRSSPPKPRGQVPNPSGRRQRRSAWKDMKTEPMPPARVLDDQRRIRNQETELAAYTIKEPPTTGLIQVHIVLAGGEHLPGRLSRPGAFDEIARTHRVFISQPQPSLILVQGEFINRLKEATRDINRAVYDMRRADTPLEGVYIVQPQSRVSVHCLVKVTIDDRPHVTDQDRATPNPSGVASALHHDIIEHFNSSVDNLKSLDGHVKLRVMFGQIIVGKKRKSMPESVGYAEFALFMEQLAKRESATLRSRLEDADQARELVARLRNPRLNPGFDVEDQKDWCELIMTTETGDLVYTVLLDHAGRPQLQSPEYFTAGAFPQMNLVVAAPDMKVDWSFRADAVESKSIPEELKSLSRAISLHPPEAPKGDDDSFQMPTVRQGWTPSSNQRISQIRIQKSIEVPYRETPFVVKVTVFREWKGGQVRTSPTEGWSLELYGKQWETSLNYIDQDTNHRNWGEGMSMVWPGPDSFEKRLEEFVRYILEVQCLVEDIA